MGSKEHFVYLKKGHMTENGGDPGYWELANETCL